MNNLGRGLELLNRNLPFAGQTDRRGWEWRYLWKRSRSDELATLGSHGHAISALVFSPTADLLASGGFDGKVKLWNWKDRLPAGELEIGDQVQALAFSPDGRWLAVRSRGHGCQLWDVAARLMIAEFNVPAADFGGALAFSPRGDLLAMNAPGSTIQIWNLPARSLIATLVGHEALVRWLIFSRDGLRQLKFGRGRLPHHPGIFTLSGSLDLNYLFLKNTLRSSCLTMIWARD
jgi:WD40 repeat protein